jgi:threonine dehydrogenase-like Zn-dependent dehydrogenase
MHAVVLTDRAEIALADRPEPVAQPGEVLIQVGAVGICGTDLHAPLMPTMFASNVVLGHEFAGTVAGRGPGVRAEAGQSVVVNPIALCCGSCPACQRGLTNQCLTALAHTSGVARDGGMHRVGRGLPELAGPGAARRPGRRAWQLPGADLAGRNRPRGIRGVQLGLPQRPGVAAALRLLARGLIDVRGLTTDIVPLSSYREAFTSLRDPDRAVKIFLDPTQTTYADASISVAARSVGQPGT